MSAQVVVIGSGYAGAGTVAAVEQAVDDDDVALTWISDRDYHLVLHEVHRVIRNPDVAEKITIPIEEIQSDDTRFIHARVDGIETPDQTIQLEDGRDIEYDYLLIGVGSKTAFYGIDGLEAHSFPLKGLDDARAIHDAVTAAGNEATRTDPAKIVVGGAGLSGIQTAGEIAELRDEKRYPMEVTIVEGLNEIFPGNDAKIQNALRERLEDRAVEIETGEFVTAVDADRLHLDGAGDGRELPYDVLIWTGGITGRDVMANTDLDGDNRSHRVYARSDFRTNDDHVFAIGDTALIEQEDDQFVPPTAQAAWQAAEVAGENLVRAVRGEPLESWTFDDKGKVISVGETAVAHDVAGLPISTFGGPAAVALKKAIAARWIFKVASVRRSIAAWSDM